MGLARIVGARIRHVLRARSDRRPHAGSPASRRGRHLSLDPEGIRRRAWFSVRLVLLDQQPLLRAGAARLHGGHSRIRRRRGESGGPRQSESVRGGRVVRLAGPHRRREHPGAGGREVDSEHRRSWRVPQRRPRAGRGGRRVGRRRRRPGTGRRWRELGDADQLRGHVQRAGRHRAGLDHGRRDSQSPASCRSPRISSSPVRS